MKTLLFLSLNFLILVACNNDGQTSTTGINNSATTTNESTTLAEDSTAIRKTITDFYDWYKDNWPKFPTTGLYKGTHSSDMPPYKIDWVAVEKYHQFIKDSVPQLGNAFIEAQKKFFEQCDAEFKKDTEGEIPYGFDYDWYTNSQEEPQYLIDEMAKAHIWQTKINGNNATVAVLGWREENGQKSALPIITFAMKKESGKWTIARIGDAL